MHGPQCELRILSISAPARTPPTFTHTEAPRHRVPGWGSRSLLSREGVSLEQGNHQRPMKGGGHEQESRPSCWQRPRSEAVDTASSLPPLRRPPSCPSTWEASPAVCPKAFLTHYSSAETHTVFVHLPNLQMGKLRPREGKGRRGSRVISTLHNCPPFLESMKLG